MAQIPKARHGLAGKNLIPVILRLKSLDPDVVYELSRLKKDYTLEDYSIVELRTEFEKLTGESVKDVLPLSGHVENMASVRMLIHFAICQANLVGGPKGQILEQDAASTSTASVKDNTLDGETSGIKNSDSITIDTATSGAANASGKHALNTDSQVTLSSLKKDLDALKNKRDDMQVDEALANIRTLASRPKFTSPHVLLAAIDILVEVANKANHKESAMFAKAFSTCKRFEENPDFCGLVLKPFWSQEDKKIESVVADWAKAKEYEDGGRLYANENATLSNLPQTNYGFPHPYPMQMPYNQMFPPPATPGFSGRPMFQRGRGGNQRKEIICFFCKEAGHIVARCPKLKKE